MSETLHSVAIFKETGITIRAGESTVALSPRGLMVETKYFSYGETAGGGIIRKIGNAYSGASFMPYFSLPSKDPDLLGAALKVGKMDFFSFTGERDGIGIGIEGKTVEGGAYWFRKGEDGSLEKESVLRRDRDTLYLALSSDFGNVGGEAIVSYAMGGKVSSFLSLKWKGEKLGAKLSLGRIQSLLSSSPLWDRGLEVKIGVAELNVTFSCLMGRKPIYRDEFRNITFSRKASLRIGETVFEAENVRTFSKGLEKTSFSLSLRGGWWKVTYDKTKGVTLSFILGASAVKVYEGGFETTVSMEKEGALIVFSSRGESEASVEVDL